MVDYGECPYHGRFHQVEWHDWQCPKREKEVMAYAKFKRTGRVTKDVKNLISRIERGE